jgi:hypothetical protein
MNVSEMNDIKGKIPRAGITCYVLKHYYKKMFAFVSKQIHQANDEQ